jgi:hypothetical protein
MKSEPFSAKILTLIFKKLRYSGAGISFPQTPFPSRPALASTSAPFAGAPPLTFLILIPSVFLEVLSDFQSRYYFRDYHYYY